MLGSELRRKYLDFFVGKGSMLIPSDSLVPNDPTLLFSSAGMVQFKPYFLGEQTPPSTRVTTVQKCLRTTDIDSVGDTSHCTFFEMLGNFSFGDYFKPEAIPWAWEFLIDVLGLDLKRLRVTVFEDDDIAFDLWRKVGMPENKIFRFGEKSNYWPANAISEGPNGPCGPCSEIFFDTQPGLPPTPDGVWDDNRWLEIWNLVFTQFKREDGGVLTPLPMKNIDTGMGLERTVAALNDLRGPFETDLFTPILDKLQDLTNKEYTRSDSGKTDIAFRRIADHVRAATFCLADGVLPSNAGRGYVLRRIMRRAILAGRNVLGFDGELLLSIIPTVIRQFSGVYTELAEKNDIVLRYASIEEKQFRRTLDDGAGRLESLLDGLAPGSKLSGDDAFTLFATYGFPLELTIESAAEHNIDVDKARFTELIEEHAKISHGGRVREVMQVNEVVRVLRDMSYKPTEFTGYDEISTKAKVLAIFSGSHSVTEASEGQSVRIVLDKTPFYAESGGQVGDTGSISGDGFEASVSDTQKDSGYFFHDVEVTAGVVKIFDHVSAKIDEKRRFAIRQNHTSTHLLHKALQSVLGSHVQQRGSLVSADKLRFDFSHDQALTEAESRKVEEYVNDLILRDLPVGTLVKPIDEAREMGAMMLFGEKYGDTVRVVQVGSESLEFCGGTHLSHTSQAGSFKLLSEGSSQAGVRRIEALTGRSALAFRTEQERILSTVAAHLKTAPGSVLATVEKLQSDLKAAEKELHELKRTAAGSLAETLAASAKDASGFKYVAVVIDEEMDGGALRELADNLLDRLKEGVVALGAKSGDRASLAVKASKSVLENKNINAGSIIKAAAQVVGGGGGGKPNFAQAGGKDPSKLADAIALAEELILKA